MVPHPFDESVCENNLVPEAKERVKIFEQISKNAAFLDMVVLQPDRNNLGRWGAGRDIWLSLEQQEHKATRWDMVDVCYVVIGRE